MSFTNQLPFSVNAGTILGFTRHKKRFGCSLCGHQFESGDTARWVYANGPDGPRCGNFFTCTTCDGPAILERAKESFATAKRLSIQWGIYGPDWQ